MLGCFCSTSAHRRVSGVTHSFPTATSIHRYRAIMRLRCDHRRVYTTSTTHINRPRTHPRAGDHLFYTHRIIMPQRQDRLQMFQSVCGIMQRTHVRTHTRRCAETRAFSHAGRGRAFFTRALRVHPSGRWRALCESFFFFFFFSLFLPLGFFRSYATT